MWRACCSQILLVAVLCTASNAFPAARVPMGGALGQNSSSMTIPHHMRVPWASLRSTERKRLSDVSIGAREWVAQNLQQTVHAAVMGRGTRGADLRTLLKERLEPLLWVKSLEWNRSAITVGFANGEVSDFGLGAGYIEWGSEEEVTPTDRLAWGSVTKVYSAAAALQLVDAGAAVLDAPIAPLFDPLLEAINSTTLADLWSPEVARELTLAQALGMRSSLSDFETDVPLRRMQLDNLADPIQNPLNALSWANKESHCFGGTGPGTCGFYSSTNYELVGLALAQAGGLSEWEAYNQRDVLPPHLAARSPNTTFGMLRTCGEYTRVAGYQPLDEMQEGDDPSVAAMSCLFGW
eukprot:COSAG02_NODE_583_length_20010_cov_4.434584_16_plen_351_part_00